MSRHRILATTAGSFALIRDDTGALSAAWVDDDGSGLPSGSTLDDTLLPDLSARLQAYFAGKPVEFDDVPTPDGPEFHRACWEACRRIPRGRTATYGELAAAAGDGPGAARAAGQAMRTNPLPVIIPCHRVVAADGSLHGYSGSRDPEGRQLATKRALLFLEGAMTGLQGRLLPV